MICLSFSSPGGSMNQVVGLPNNLYKLITNTTWVRARLCKLQTRVHSTHRWFSPGTPASSTTKTGHNDITKILLKVALNTNNQNQILLEQMSSPIPSGSVRVARPFNYPCCVVFVCFVCLRLVSTTTTNFQKLVQILFT